MAEFFKHEIAKWNVATDDLTLEQEAAYHRVVSQIRLYERPFRENYRVLSGLWRCNERRAKRLLRELVAAGKLTVNDGLIIDEKAVHDAWMLRQLRIDKQSAGRRGGIESGKSRRKALENIETGEAHASTKLDKARQDETREEGGGNSSDEESPPPLAAGGSNFLVEIARAAGYQPGAIPKAWTGQKASDLVAAWRGAGLSDDEILDRTRQSRTVHPEPPASPQALAGFMVKAPAPKPANPVDRAAMLRLWAEAIRKGASWVVSAVSPRDAREMLAMGIVTEGQLRTVGVHH